MSEGTNIGINLDAKSVDILRGVNASFRDTLVNIGLRMVENTELYLTLSGKSKNTDVENMVSLEQIDEENLEGSIGNSTPKKKEETKPEKPKTSWDSF